MLKIRAEVQTPQASDYPQAPDVSGGGRDETFLM